MVMCVCNLCVCVCVYDIKVKFTYWKLVEFFHQFFVGVDVPDVMPDINKRLKQLGREKAFKQPPVPFHAKQKSQSPKCICLKNKFGKL